MHKRHSTNRDLTLALLSWLALAVGSILFSIPALADDTGFDSATASSSGTWTTPANVYTSNNVRASITTMANECDVSLCEMFATNFGFALPTNAIIDSVIGSWEGYYQTADPQIYFGLTKDGTTLSGTEWFLSPNPSEASFIYNGGGWSANLTAAQANASTFGVRLRATYGGSSTGYVDQVRLRIYYHTVPTTATRRRQLLMREN